MGKHINQNEKTLVFCATQDMRGGARPDQQMKTSKDTNYCQRVTANRRRWASSTCGTFRTTKRAFPPS